jgi:hypothetical protein
MLAFDAPRRAVCIAKRERTDSPLQALILLNGIQYVEAARVLAESLHQETQGNLDAMIQLGWKRCLSRSADDRETAILKQLYVEQKAFFEKNPEQATQLISIGSKPPNASIPPQELAAIMVMAQVMLNHDECVVKR